MTESTEVLPPQNTVVVTPPNGDTVSILKKELDDLTHKAEVSSQNFERVKKLEARIQELEDGLDPLSPPVYVEDEGGKIKEELGEIKAKLAKAEVIEAHPELKEVWSEFEQFRGDESNKGMNLRTAAKAFLIEKGLLDPRRKGLEKPTGGTRTPPSSGMTTEDIKRLRETDFKKYREMLKRGQLKVD